MTSINSLIAGTPSYAAHLGNFTNIQGPQSIAPPEAGQAPADVVFERGQWWKNSAVRSSGVTPTEKGQCGCQACSACAAQAYQAQAGQALQPTINKGDTSEQYGGGGQQSGDRSTDPSGPEGGSRGGREENSSDPTAGTTPTGRPLTQEQKLELAQLQQADTAIRAHEMAHLAAAGPYAKSGATFQYKRGPDGKNYAVAGEVQIDTSKEPTPEATIRKMRMVRAAALAPADPSPQDRKVAAAATSTISTAIQELRMLKLKEVQTEGERTAEEVQRTRESGFEETGAAQAGLNASPLGEGGIETAASPAQESPSAFMTKAAAKQMDNTARYQHPVLSIFV